MRPSLSFHMAGLAQPNQVAPAIRIFFTGEFTKGPDVMDGQTQALMNATVGTRAFLLPDHHSSRRFPATPPVSFRAAYPIRSGSPREVQRPILAPAGCRAEIPFVSLPQHPGFQPKLFRALFAGSLDRFNETRVLLSSQLAHFEASAVGFCVWLQGILSLAFATATTELRSLSFRQDHGKRLPALSAVQFNVHAYSLPPFMGIGSTGFQALKMGRKALGVELKEAYWRHGLRNMRAAEVEGQGALFEIEAGAAD